MSDWNQPIFCGHFFSFGCNKKPFFYCNQDTLVFEMLQPQLSRSAEGLLGPECHMSEVVYFGNYSSGFTVVRQPICNIFTADLPSSWTEAGEAEVLWMKCRGIPLPWAPPNIWKGTSSTIICSVSADNSPVTRHASLHSFYFECALDAQKPCAEKSQAYSLHIVISPNLIRPI